MKYTFVKAFSWLLLLFVVATCFSCRTVKRKKQSQSSSIDSSFLSKHTGTKQTFTTEKVDTPIVFNPGNLTGEFDSDDTTEQTFETDGFKVSVKPGSKGASGLKNKSTVKVEGKDQKKNVQVNKTTYTKEQTKDEVKVTVNKKQSSSSFEKYVTGIPWWVWVIVLVVVLILGYIYFSLKSSGTVLSKVKDVI